jgi:hypothetical protein
MALVLGWYDLCKALNKHLAEFTKYVASPTIGVSGVEGVMVVLGPTNAILSLLARHLTTGFLSITLITSGGIIF